MIFSDGDSSRVETNKSGRNQSIDLHCKLIVWFLCDVRFFMGEFLNIL